MFQWISLINIDPNRITDLLLLIRLKAHIDFQYQSVRRLTSFPSSQTGSSCVSSMFKSCSALFCSFVSSSLPLYPHFWLSHGGFQSALLFFFLIFNLQPVRYWAGRFERPAPNHPAPYLPPFSLTFPLIRFAQHFYFSAAK